MKLENKIKIPDNKNTEKINFLLIFSKRYKRAITIGNVLTTKLPNTCSVPKKLVILPC